MNSGYYKAYRAYISYLLLLTLYGWICAAALVAFKIGVEWMPSWLVIIMMAILAVSIVGWFVHWCFLPCPCCGTRSMTMDRKLLNAEPPFYYSTHFFVRCRHCGYEQDTDLGMKTNIFIKSIPVKMR